MNPEVAIVTGAAAALGEWRHGTWRSMGYVCLPGIAMKKRESRSRLKPRTLDLA